MGTEARGVAFVTHVADEELFVGVQELEAGFEGAELHHARAETVSDQDDTGVFFQGKRGRSAGDDAEEKGENFFHRPVGYALGGWIQC